MDETRSLLRNKNERGEFKGRSITTIEDLSIQIAKTNPLDYGKIFPHIRNHYKSKSTKNRSLLLTLGLLYYLAVGKKIEFHTLLEEMTNTKKKTADVYPWLGWVLALEQAVSLGYPSLLIFPNPPEEYSGLFELVKSKQNALALQPERRMVETGPCFDLCRGIAWNLEKEF